MLAPVLAISVAAKAPAIRGQIAANRNIVALGEIQRSYHTVAALLDHLQLIDSTRRWSGGSAILVQTGDLVDDGADVRATLDLFMRLLHEAAAAGGQVIVLMGNHEAQNVLGKLGDVNPLAYQRSAGPDSEFRRLGSWREWSTWATRRAEAVGESFIADKEAESKWRAAHP